MKNRINITAKIILKAALLSIVFTMPAFASYIPFNTNVRMNVGIGSANPGQSLDVQGTVRATAFIGSGSQLTGITSTVWTTTNTNDVYLPNNGNVGIGTTITSAGAALTVMNGNVGIGTWVPGGSLIVQGGNVGIGNNKPTTTLSVGNAFTYPEGAVTIDAGTPAGGIVPALNLGVTSTETAGNGVTINFTTGSAASGFTPNASITAVQDASFNASMYFSLYNGGGPYERMRITPSGNVGIGTTNPQGALTVMNGNVGIGTIRPGALLDVDGYIRSTSNGFIFPDGSIQTVAASGGNSWSMASGNVYLTTASNNVGIGTAAPTGFEIESHNVGIGTWAPASLLTMAGGNNITFTGVSAQHTTSTVGTDNSDQLVMASSQGSGKGTFLGPENGTFVETTASEIVLATGNGSSTTQMVVGYGSSNSLGNVGIGTNKPQTLLSVVGGNVGIGTWTAAGGNLIVNGGGNVGIGSAWPGQALDVQGTVRATAFIGNGTGLTGISSTVWTTTNTNDVYLPNNGNVGLGTTITSAGAALAVMNGNVGIGTWVPAEQLSLNGSAYVTGTVYNSGQYGGQIDLNTPPFGAVYGMASNNINHYLYVYTSTIMDFQTGNFGGTTVAQFGPGSYAGFMGNVGIGTTLSTNMLDVAAGVSIGTTYAGYQTAPPNGLAVQGNVGIGTWIPSTSLDVLGTISSNPSATTNITAGGGITVTRAIMRIQGSGGAVTVTANPEIAAGQDGQIVVLEGMSSTNTVKLTNGTGLRMAGGVSFTLDNGATITFIYDATNSVWTETSRSAN